MQTGRSVKPITEANDQLPMIMYTGSGAPGEEPVAPVVSPVLFNILVNDLEER